MSVRARTSLLRSRQASSRTEYKIDVHAEHGEEDDHRIHQRDKKITKVPRRLGLRYIVTVSGVSREVATVGWCTGDVKMITLTLTTYS